MDKYAYFPLFIFHSMFKANFLLFAFFFRGTCANERTPAADRDRCQAADRRMRTGHEPCSAPLV